ncbi:hypothetical protein HYT58_02220 [Candidatus Woesearchaeota archaeon]|nr:hypothetical protein [Candidatus Woesearchaeota archaeon]
MKLVVDTGALLSLACSTNFELIIKSYNLIITNSVLNELKEFTRYEDFLGLKAKNLIKRKIKVKNPSKIINLNLEKAESEIFSLAKEEKCIALTDDIHAARIAEEKLKINIKPSFYLLLLLYKNNKIKKEDIIKDIESILEFRGWLDGALWEYALNLIKNL